MIDIKGMITVIDGEDAKRLGMELESWNIYFFVRHEGEEYAVAWNPSCSGSIDDDFYHQIVREFEGEEE